MRGDCSLSPAWGAPLLWGLLVLPDPQLTLWGWPLMAALAPRGPACPWAELPGPGGDHSPRWATASHLGMGTTR